MEATLMIIIISAFAVFFGWWLRDIRDDDLSDHRLYGKDDPEYLKQLEDACLRGDNLSWDELNYLLARSKNNDVYNKVVKLLP